MPPDKNAPYWSYGRDIRDRVAYKAAGEWVIVEDRPDGDTSIISFINGTLVRERIFNEHPRGAGYGSHVTGVALTWIPH